MKVFEGECIEPDFIHSVNKHFNGGFVVQDHLRLDGILSLSDLPFFDKVLRI